MINVIIIGSGPAGYTAAIYASRAGLNPVLFAGIKHGGQLMETTDVDNFPGYKDGISGPELMEDIRLQAIRFGTEVNYNDIVSVDFNSYPFKLTDDNDKQWESKSVIISTGANAKWLGIDSEKKFMGYGVSACATCDGFFFKNKDVVVVGGGDTACEEAIYLSNMCRSVTMLIRSDKMRASRIMQEKAELNPKIKILFNTSVNEIKGDNFVDGILTSNGFIKCDGVFIAIGHSPNTSIFKEFLELDGDGYIITKGKSTKTSINGIFACGDVQDRTYRQAITAAGTGCMAALDAEKFLSSQ